MKEIRQKQLEVRDILKALDKRHKVLYLYYGLCLLTIFYSYMTVSFISQELDAIQEHIKTLTVVSDNEDEQEEENEVDMYCITCGHQIHTRTAIKHMEKCFNKVLTYLHCKHNCEFY